MKIKKVELTNVKCYANAEFDFENGINFISGMNGAGKTSIIESIGFALFDYKIGKSGFTTYFIKRGEKKAVVRIMFEDKESKTYIVERKISISSNNSWIVKDIEKEEEIVSGELDVTNWLKDHLGFYREDNIAQIYENIISVPQGMFTSAFLDTVQARKNKFDPIFNLEIYRTIYKNTSSLDTGLKSKKLNYENEVKIINAKIDIFKNDKTEYTNLKKEVSTKKQEKKNIEKEYKDIDKIYEEKSNIKRDIAKLEGSIQISTVKLENINNNIESYTNELNLAKQAKKILDANKQGYENYIQAEKQQKEFKVKKKEFDSINENKKSLLININGCNKTIELKSENKNELKETIKLLEKEVISIDEKIQNKDKELSEKLLKLEEDRRNIEELQEKERMLEEQKRVIEKNELLIQGNLDNIKRLEKTIVNEKELLEKKKALEESINARNDVEKQIGRIEEELSKLFAKLEQAKESKKIAKDGVCPYLKSECINVKGKTEKEYDIEIEQLESKILNIKKEKLAKEKQEKEIIKAEAELKNLLNKIEEMNQAKIEVIELEKKNGEIKETNKQLEGKIIESLSKIGLTKKEEFKKYNQNKQLEFNKKDTEYNVLKTKLEGIKKERNQKNDELLKNNNLLNKIETEIQEENSNIQNYKEKIEILENKLKEYDTIENDIEENEKRLQNNKVAYETYMQNKEIANKLENTRKVIEECKIEQEKLQKVLQESKIKLQNLNNEYSEEELKKIEKNRSELKDNLIKVNIEIEKSEERIGALKEHVEELKRMQEKVKDVNINIVKYQKAIEYLAKIRQIIKQAPEDIAQILIQKVNRKATEIYSKIANDNTRLEWREGYEVILVDSIEGKIIEKEFKQLSGGEQMSAALAIRISMLEILTNLKIGILDEPTVNMDIGRRQRLAEIIESIGGVFIQLFVVSHDDTFNAITENTIQL